MSVSFVNHFNTIRFILSLKKNKDKGKDKNKENLNELIAIASRERGVLYKLLQMLFPDQITSHENQLQALTKEKIISIIEKELAINFNEHFIHLSEAILCASIGQVHKAEINYGPDKGTIVAIKIQYPQVEKSIKSQIKFLKMAVATSKFGPMAKWHIDMNAHLLQIENALLDELDYHKELNNLLKVQNFNSSLKLNFSIKPFLQYSTSRIITQSWVNGVDLDYIKNHWSSHQKKLVAEKLMDNFLKQIFKDGFFQGDTNITNFLFQEDITDKSNLFIHWIDFGNWCSLSSEVGQSIFVLISEAINESDSNYLGHFEKIGFDLGKLRYLQNLLPQLVGILFEPFLTNRPYDLDAWKLEERIDALLGENKWWFRSSGNSHLLELMKSFFGLILIIKMLKININWQNILLKYSNYFNSEEINKNVAFYANTIPTNNLIAKNLIIIILKNSIEHVKIEFPATSLFDLENLIPDETKKKLIEQSFDIVKIKFNYLQNGLIPGEVFSLETVETINSKIIINHFRIYLI